MFISVAVVSALQTTSNPLFTASLPEWISSGGTVLALAGLVIEVWRNGLANRKARRMAQELAARNERATVEIQVRNVTAWLVEENKSAARSDVVVYVSNKSPNAIFNIEAHLGIGGVEPRQIDVVPPGEIVRARPWSAINTDSLSSAPHEWITFEDASDRTWYRQRSTFHLSGVQ